MFYFTYGYQGRSPLRTQKRSFGASRVIRLRPMCTICMLFRSNLSLNRQIPTWYQMASSNITISSFSATIGLQSERIAIMFDTFNYHRYELSANIRENIDFITLCDIFNFHVKMEISRTKRVVNIKGSMIVLIISSRLYTTSRRAVWPKSAA